MQRLRNHMVGWRAMIQIFMSEVDSICPAGRNRFFLFADDMLLCVESKLNLFFLKLTIVV